MNTSRKLVLLLVVMLVVALQSAPFIQPALAINPPASPSQAFYVNATTAWESNAFQRGVAASPGVSRHIILHFGRQVEPARSTVGGVWGVKLHMSAQKTNAWVRLRAQQFIDGYNSVADHPNTTVIIGTANSNFDWTCSNNPPLYSGLWEFAGRVWAQEVINPLTGGSKVTVYSGNDIEPWTGLEEIFGDWTACGLGTLEWMDGFEAYTNRHYNTNYGNNGNLEHEPQWTVAQVHDLSGGRRWASWSMPQIYCRAPAGTEGQAQSWANDIREYKYMYFKGVTSTNGLADCSTPLSWSEAWDELQGALEANNHSFDLGHSVSSFNYSP